MSIYNNHLAFNTMSSVFESLILSSFTVIQSWVNDTICYMSSFALFTIVDDAALIQLCIVCITMWINGHGVKEVIQGGHVHQKKNGSQCAALWNTTVKLELVWLVASSRDDHSPVAHVAADPVKNTACHPILFSRTSASMTSSTVPKAADMSMRSSHTWFHYFWYKLQVTDRSIVIICFLSWRFFYNGFDKCTFPTGKRGGLL